MTMTNETMTTEPKLETTPGIDWRPWLVGGNLLYLASAICILIGIGQVVVPGYQADKPAANLQGWVALGVYELLLLAVALVIVLWRQVLDDAVSLTVLIAAFLVGSAITLDTVALYWPQTAVWMGVGSLLLAAGKLEALRRWIATGPTQALAVLGLGLILAWNFLMPGVLGAQTARPGALEEEIWPWWLAGWYWTLAAGLVVLVAAWRVPDGQGALERQRQPFLRTSGMRWIVVGIVLAGSFVHQYALNWVSFKHPQVPGDFLLAVGLVTLVAIEVRRAQRWGGPGADVTLAALPLCLLVVVLVNGAHVSELSWEFGVVGHPAVFAVLMAVGLEAVAWFRWRPVMHLPAAVYAVIGLSVLGRHAGKGQANLGPWLWVAASFGLLVLGAVASLVKSRQAASKPGQSEAK